MRRFCAEAFQVLGGRRLVLWPAMSMRSKGRCFRSGYNGFVLGAKFWLEGLTELQVSLGGSGAEVRDCPQALPCEQHLIPSGAP